MSKIKAIISGADGTLINNLYLIRHGQYEAAVEYMVERGIGRNDIPGYEDYESFINKSVGGSTRDTFEKTLRLLFGERHAEHLKAIDFDELDRRLEPIQDRLAPLYTHPFHGLTEMLTWMGKEHLALGIFTSASRYQIVRNLGVALPALGYGNLSANVRASEDEKTQALTERTKAVYGISKFSIVTSDDVKKTKPDPEGLVKALKELGVKPDEAIMVGDLDADIIAGVKAGVASVGIAHGFGTPADLQAAGAVRVVDDLNELVAAVEAHNSGERKLF
jgi:phosphoglycolate phosphatase-like HAD superfamily hydrolase